MIGKILIGIHGGFWRVKKSLQGDLNPLLRKYYTFIYRTYLYENGADIAVSSHFENEPCMPHGERGVFISGTAKVGKNAVIFQQVTIGSISLPDSKGLGAPTIGDNCYIGAGAKIVGNIKVGNNVRIGANAVVYEDVPDNAVVVSGKQRTIVKDQPLLNRYYTYNDATKERLYFEDGKWVVETDEEILKKLDSQG